ncbi:hypothetical protein ACFVT1_34975 [Streptomyces sp. NPDC057963]|uniref:hypothetical protein n=1 Tax=Streptomyces sp. NPDC057963 TaxID=3346290 RepID=UPI0036F11F43
MNKESFTVMGGGLLREALGAWRAGNRDFSVLYAGIACEHMLKAVLCHHDPVLISDKGDMAHRFQALGFSEEDGAKPLKHAKTIGMSDAFKGAAIVMRGKMPISHQEFEPVMESRNGRAHSAWHDDEVTEKVVALSVQVAEAIRIELSIASDDFWGEFDGVHMDLAKVAALPVKVERPDIETAATELIAAEEKEAFYAGAVAGQMAVSVALGGSHERSGEERETVQNFSSRAAVKTALQCSGLRAQRAAVALLESYEVLPLDRHPVGGTRLKEFPYYSPGPRAEQARTALAVKTMVARRVAAGFQKGCSSGSGDAAKALSSAYSNSVRVVASGSLEAVAKVIVSVFEHGTLGAAPFTDDVESIGWMFHCPACGAWGDMYGNVEQEECPCDGHPNCQSDDGIRTITTPQKFYCTACSLTLDDKEELEAAALPSEEEDLDEKCPHG